MEDKGGLRILRCRALCFVIPFLILDATLALLPLYLDSLLPSIILPSLQVQVCFHSCRSGALIGAVLVFSV